MGPFVVFVLAMVFIGIAWGFNTVFWLFVVWRFLAWLGKPAHSYDTNWTSFVCIYVLKILGLFAIHDQWHDNTITAIAIGVTLLLEVLGRSSRRSW